MSFHSAIIHNAISFGVFSVSLYFFCSFCFFISNDAKITQKKKKQPKTIYANEWMVVCDLIDCAHALFRFFAFILLAECTRTTIDYWLRVEFSTHYLSTEDSKRFMSTFLYTKFKFESDFAFEGFSSINNIIIQNHKYPITIHIKPSGPSHFE